jgi:oligosaccharide repeat unit polymerase
MKAAFVISVAYAFFGCLYAPGMNSIVALLFIVVSCSPLLVASVFESSVVVNPHQAPSAIFFWLSILLGLINLAVIASSVGYSSVDILSLEGFANIAMASSEKRYTEGGNSGSPVILAFSLLLIYRLGAADTSVSVGHKILGFLPIVAYSLLCTEKWPMFLSCIFFLAGIFNSRGYQRAATDTLRYALVFMLVGFGLAGLALVLRGFSGDYFELPEQILHYLLAPSSALGAWIVSDAIQQCCTLGALTFIGPLDALGLAHRSGGVFSENVIVYGLETNIYTGWRYLIQDFSLLGPLLLNTVIATSFIALRATRMWRAASALSGFAIISALLSLTVTPFVHNSVLLAVVFALAYTVLSIRRVGAPQARAVASMLPQVNRQHV